MSDAPEPRDPTIRPGSLEAEIKQTVRFATLEEESYIALVRTADLLSRAVFDLLKGYDLTPVQYNVLRILRGAGSEGRTMREIGDRLITRDPDVTRLVDRLEARGLLTRQREEDDRRVVRAWITDEGKALIARLDNPLLVLHFGQMGVLDRQEQETLVALLERLRRKVAVSG